MDDFSFYLLIFSDSQAFKMQHIFLDLELADMYSVNVRYFISQLHHNVIWSQNKHFLFVLE